MFGVARRIDWDRAGAAITAYLGPDEPPEAMFPAMTPRPFSEGLLIAAELAPVVRAVEDAMWWHRSRSASRKASVPLAPRMIIAVTGRRLVIWSARHNWRLGSLAGELPRSRILRAEAAEVPVGATGWCTVLLHLADGQTVTIRASAETVTALTSRLSANPLRT
jgi:hypothetical protein